MHTLFAMSVDDFVVRWRSLDTHPLPDEAKKAFAASISDIYDEDVDYQSPGPGLDDVVDDCLEVSAFMISYFTARTDEVLDYPTLYQKYVVADGRAYVPQTYHHFLIQLMLACCMTLSMDDSCKGLDREYLKTIRLFDDGEPRAETNKEVQHTEEWHRVVGTQVLTAQPVLDALTRTHLASTPCVLAISATQVVMSTGEELQGYKDMLEESMTRGLEGFDSAWDVSRTFDAIVRTQPSEEVAVYAFAMWAYFMVA